MIHLGEESPRWLKELSRFVPLKNIIFIHGDIFDIISYPVTREAGGEVYWTESNDFSHFMERYLADLEYEVIGFLDPVEGMRFPTDEMQTLFKKLQSGKVIIPQEEEKKNIKQQEMPASAETSTVPGTSTAAPTPPPRRPRPVDIPQALDSIRMAVSNTTIPCAFVINLASRLLSSPSHLACGERDTFTRILKSSLVSQQVVRENKRWNNLIFLVCDKLNDIPPFMYINNPRSRSIFIDKPDEKERMRFIKRNYKYFFGAAEAEPPQDIASQFAVLTEGLAYYEMKSLISLSMKEKIPIQDPVTKTPRIRNICEMYKYGITESDWDKIDRSRLEAAETFIHSRIKGQDAAVSRVLDIIKRAKIGLAAGTSQKQSRPRGVLFFAGPTGVGKTEMAKALAELLFGQEERCIRFDMSEYAAEHADQRLLGAPPGYVGYEEGGQLTNTVKEHPFSVLLFDEIEKAHVRIFDKFLQILDDGRLTDGKGDTVYFSESIIIFTSNLGTVSTQHDDGNQRVSLVTPDMPYLTVKEKVLEAIRDHFNFVLGRPEILNRFGDNFVVFDFIRPPVDEMIVDLLVSKLSKVTLENKKIYLTVEPSVRKQILYLSKQYLHHGGRGIRNIMDSALVNPLNRVLFDMEIQPGTKLVIQELVDHGENVPYRFELITRVEK
jgi:DNA polymerase III delta prime subunit